MANYDLIIIGAGPAGMNACLYASRANLKTLVIERNCPGGKMIKTQKIENWITSKEISGTDLALEMFKNSFSFGGEYLQGNVMDIIDKKDHKEVVLETKKITCYAVIIATGTSEKKIGIEGEEKFYGKGVSYCTICDASLYKNKVVAIAGTSFNCIDEAIYLSKFASKVYLLNENKVELQEIDNDKIEVINNCKLIAIKGDTTIKSILVKKENEIKEIEVSCIFPLYGNIPDTHITSRLNLVDDKNYVEVNDKQETKIEGIYAAGDCTNSNLKQIITACSDGAIAATQAYKYINKIKTK